MIYLLFCAIITTAIEHLRYGFYCAWNIKIDNFRFAAIFMRKLDMNFDYLFRSSYMPV